MTGKNSDIFQDVKPAGSSKQGVPRQTKAKHVAPATLTSGDVSQAEKELAQKALSDFNKGNYLQASSALDKLQVTRPNDFKVALNKAVVEYYKSGLCETDTFTAALTDITAQRSKTNTGSSGGGGGQVVAGSVGVWPAEDSVVDSSVLQLNQAVVLYHHRQFARAVLVLIPLYVALESLDEGVGITVCLLLAWSCLHCSRPDNTLAIVCQAEATFLPQSLPQQPLPQQALSQPLSQHTHPQSTAAVHQRQSSSSPPTHTTPTHHHLRERGGSTAASTASTTAAAAITTASCGSGSSGPVGFSSPEEGGEGNSGGSGRQEELRRRLQLLRVRALISLSCLELAGKQFKVALTHAVHAGNKLELSQISLKSQLKFLRGQHLEALKILNMCAALPEPRTSVPAPSTGPLPPGKIRSVWPSRRVWYYNNLGVVHAGQGRHTLALLYLHRALQAFLLDQESFEDNGGRRPLYDSGAGIGAALTYNMALVLLQLNKTPQQPRKAFQLLLETARVHHDNPRIWLRIAQCCVAVHLWEVSGKDGTEMGPAEDKAAPTVKIVGSGRFTRLLLQVPRENSSKDGKAEVEAEESAGAGPPQPRLSFGRLCLRNALKLLPPPGTALAAADDEEATAAQGVAPPKVVHAAPSLPLREGAAAVVLQACLACAAYTSLRLGLYHDGLQHAKELLDSLPTSHKNYLPGKATATYKFLGHLYAGECSLMLGKPDLAIEFLKYQHTKITYEVPEDDRVIITEETYTMQYNLAVVYAGRGDYDKASSLLQDLWRTPPPLSSLVMLMLFLHLKQGHIEKAKSLVKEHLLQT